MIIVRKYGSFHSLQFEIDLSEYGKSSADIQDIVFSVKEKETDDDDSIFLKKKSLGQITNSTGDVLEVFVEWGPTEYDNFVLGKKYKAGLFVQFIGDPSTDENVNTLYEIKIVQDYLRT